MPPGWIPQESVLPGQSTSSFSPQDPVIDFYSTQNGSGGNVTWDVTLPVDRNATANQSDLYEAAEFGMTVTAPGAWLDQCFLQLQLYPDASYPGPKTANGYWTSDNGNWVGYVIGWQIQASTGLENPCFAEPLYENGDKSDGFLNLTQGDRINVTMTGWPGDPTGELLTVEDLTHPSNMSYVMAFNSTGNYPLDPAYSTNDVPDALQWSTGGDLPVFFGIVTGRAGNPSVPRNATTGTCSPGPPPSSPSNPDVPCPSYDPGSWINDTLHPWQIDPPTFFNGTVRSATPPQVSFSQTYGSIDETSASAGTACAGRVGSAHCSFPWFSYSCALDAFEFGATDYPGVSSDFGQYEQYSGTLQHNAADLPFYAPVSYSVPTCGQASYSLTVGPTSSGGSVEFLSHAYGSPTTVHDLAPGTYQVNSTPPTGMYFSDWAATGGIVPAQPDSPWTSVLVSSNGSLSAEYSASPQLVAVTFDDSPRGEIAISPGYFANSEGTTETVQSGAELDLQPGIYSILAYPPQGFEFSGWTPTSLGESIAAPSLPLTDLVLTGQAATGLVTANYSAVSESDRIVFGAYDLANSTFNGGKVSFGPFTTHTFRDSGSISIGTYNLSATPAAGYTFAGWYYTQSSIMLNFSSSTNITLENGTFNKTIPTGVVLALFHPDPVDVTFMAVGGSGGAVVAGFGYVTSGGVLALTPGINYTASAAPGTGSLFVSWGPLLSTTIWNRASGNWTERLVVNGSGIVDVYFGLGVKESLEFHVAPAGAGQIIFNGDNTYSNGTTNSTVISGETYLVEAVPSTGYTFGSWGAFGGVTPGPKDSSNSTVAITGSGDLNATFVPTTFPVTVLAVPPQPATLAVDGVNVGTGSTVLLAPGSHTILVKVPGETLDSWSASPSLSVSTPHANSTSFTVSGPGSLTALITPFFVEAPSVSPTPVDVGISTSFQSAVPVSGGSPTYTAEWSGLPDGCTSEATEVAFSCAPSVAGDYDVSVTFTDAWGEPAASPPVVLRVNPLPTLIGPSLSISAVDAGIPTNISAAVSGGTGPFTWNYTGLPGGCSTVNESLLTCSATQTGTFNVTVNVSDRFGETAHGTIQLVVNALPSVTMSASATTLTVGTTVTVTTAVSGGTAPITLNYTGLPPGCAATAAASFSCAPSAAGTYHITVTAKDAFGKTASQVLTLVVNTAPPSIFGISYLDLGVGLLALVVIALVVFVSLRRRPKKPTIVATPAAASSSQTTRPAPTKPAVPEWSEEPEPLHEWKESP